MSDKMTAAETQTPRTLTDAHIHEGGTHITNFEESKRPIYNAAVEEFAERDLIVSEKTSSHMSRPGGALHWIGEQPCPDLSYFWRLFDIARLRSENATLERALAEANGRAEKETRRADAWVKAARDLSRELGMADDESDGSIRDWQHIRSKLQMRLARATAAEAELRAVREDARRYCDKWEHGCDALCTGIALWIHRCPHCGMPAPSALASTATGESHDGGREG